MRYFCEKNRQAMQIQAILSTPTIPLQNVLILSPIKPNTDFLSLICGMRVKAFGSICVNSAVVFVEGKQFNLRIRKLSYSSLNTY